MLFRSSLQYVYISDGTTVWECADTSASTLVWNACTFNTSGSYTAPGTGEIYSMDCTDGYVFVATKKGIFYYSSTAGTRVFYGYAKTDGTYAPNGYSLVRYCNNRVVAAQNGGPTLFVFQPTHISGNYPTTGGGPTTTGANQDIMMTHPNPNFRWIDACGGSSAIYYAGYANGTTPSGGQVCKSGVVVDATTLAVSLAYPTIALPLSPDEIGRAHV